MSLFQGDEETSWSTDLLVEWCSSRQDDGRGGGNLMI